MSPTATGAAVRLWRPKGAKLDLRAGDCRDGGASSRRGSADVTLTSRPCRCRNDRRSDLRGLQRRNMRHFGNFC